MNNWILPAIVTVICWGIWGFVPKITIQYINPMSAIIFESIGVIIVAVVVLWLLGFHPEIHPKGVGLAILTGIIGMIGALGFLFAVKSGKVSNVVMFTAMSPILTILLAYLLLKEPITLREGIGILFAFAALFLIAK
jgi:transporter family protein